MEKKDDYAIQSFETPAQWETWLQKNHQKAPGLWLRLFKKASQISSLTYDEALEGALCYGWIDGLKKSYDETSWLQKFTPRRAKSSWSKRNVALAEALIKQGKMKPAGLAEIKAAKKDGRWEKAYAGQKDMTLPPDFLAQLKKDKKAWAFFQTLNAANRYAFAYRLNTAKKPETKQRRAEQFLKMLNNGQTFHPLSTKKKT